MDKSVVDLCDSLSTEYYMIYIILFYLGHKRRWQYLSSRDHNKTI